MSCTCTSPPPDVDEDPLEAGEDPPTAVLYVDEPPACEDCTGRDVRDQLAVVEELIRFGTDEDMFDTAPDMGVTA